MFQKGMKKLSAWLLAASLVMGMVQLPAAQADAASDVASVAAGLSAPTVSQDGKSISMPTVPTGMTLKFYADYEQVIGEDGTIYTPLENKEIKGVYEVSQGETKAKSEEFTVNVPGEYTGEAEANAKPDVIPELQEWHGGNGLFLVSKFSRIVIADDALLSTANRFAADYEDIIGMEIPVVKGTLDDAQTGDFFLTLDTDDKGLGEEGYRLDISNVTVVEAEQTTGVNWGVVTILQILKQSNGSIPMGLIRDYPKFEVRGFSLDVGRKPFSMDSLKQFAKNMAWYKMNSFQVHLNDDLIFMEDYYNRGEGFNTMQDAIDNAYAGFRLESSLHNDEGVYLHSDDMYYTKDEFRDFIKDSKDMGLNIVPEFDMPAHAFAITKVFEDCMTKSATTGRYRIDELDLSDEKYDESVQLAKDIWADYFEGDDPVFPEYTTVHIGTDEFHGVSGTAGEDAFRRFSDDLIKFVQGTGRDVRMWGSLTNKKGSGEVPVASKDVQLNIWNTGYADPQAMHDLGYDLINTLEGWGYIVPAAGYYNDYINAQNIYNNWKPNVIDKLSVSAGDPQILGGCYAIWHDSIDTRQNGISNYDSFDRFIKALPAYSAKTWGDAKDKAYAQFAELTEKTGTAPNTNMYYEVESLTKKVLDYDFETADIKDKTANGYDAIGKKNVSLVNTESGKALSLKGGESYVTTPIDKIGPSYKFTAKVKMDEDAEGEQILTESLESFGGCGPYAVKAVQRETGQVGFSREGIDFSFDYTLPKGKWVELTIEGGQEISKLYVDGVLTSTLNNDTVPEGIMKGIRKTNTLVLPLGHIGSTSKSFKGQIEYLSLETEKAPKEVYGAISRGNWTAEACSVSPSTATEGPINYAIDGNPSTYWHTNWSENDGDTTVSDENPHWFKITLQTPKVIDKLTYLPRQDSVNGRITSYGIEVETPAGETQTVVQKASWANNTDLKTASFEPIEAKSVKLLIYAAGNGHGTIAELNLCEPDSFGKNELQAELNKYAAYNENDYTAPSWEKFEKACASVKAVIESAEGTTEDYRLAYETLQDAVKGLKAKPVENRFEESLRDSQDFEEGDFSGSSAKEYQEAVEAAKNLPSDATDAQKLAAAKAVEAAKAKLVDVKEAKEELAKENNRSLAGYTDASVNAYNNAKKNVEEAIRNASSKEELEKALESLRSAITGLARKSEGSTQTPPDKPGTPGVSVGMVIQKSGAQYQVTKVGADATVELVKAPGNKKKFTIPATIKDGSVTYKVTSIANNAFQKSKKLKSVTVGANVTKIGNKSFYKCAKLAKVTFKCVKAPKIGGQAFKGTAAKMKVTAPKKMGKKQFNKLKKAMKKAGAGKKAVYKMK